jgi:hypothetical protein
MLFAVFTSGAVFLYRHHMMTFAWNWIIPFIGLGSCVVAACALFGNRILARTVSEAEMSSALAEPKN